MSTNKAVCEHPRGLGYDFVVQDTGYTEPSCHVCYTLLVAHNERGEHFRRWNDRPTLVVNPPKSLAEEEPNLARIIYAVCLAALVVGFAAFIVHIFTS